MRKILVIGIGAGNPEHMTVQAIKALNRADVLLIPTKGAEKAYLADVRREICDRFLENTSCRILDYAVPVRRADGSYEDGVHDWHRAIAGIYERTLLTELGEDQTLGLLVWGDPMLYDSSLRIAARVARRLPLKLRVIPGITAIQALCAAHAIPLNEVAAPVTITTGRQIRDHGWPQGTGRAVVMLDGDCAFQTLDPQGLHIWWGAFLGMSEEMLIAGPLAEVGPRILATRARARAAHGWIMDIYLLSRDG